MSLRVMMRMGALLMSAGSQVNEAFKGWAERVIAGRSLRSLARDTGISHTRISDMLFGVVPSYQLLQKFCEALGLSDEDRAEGFRAANYGLPADLADDPKWLVRQLLTSTGKRVGDLTEEEIKEISVRGWPGAEELTDGQVDTLDEIVRQELRDIQEGHRDSG